MENLIEKNSKHYKKAQVVMLETENNKEDFFIGKFENSVYFLSKRHKSGGVLKAQHLYFLSEEEIKEGDKIIHKGSILTVLANRGLYLSVLEFSHIDIRTDTCKKVIATTDSCINENDTKLKDVTYRLLPKPTIEFIQDYIESYNNGDVINEVLVEVYTTHETSGHKFLNYKVKEDNTIIVDKNEDFTPLLHDLDDKTITEAALMYAARNYSGTKMSNYIMKVAEYCFIAGAEFQKKNSYNKDEVSNLLRKIYYEATGQSTGHPDGFYQKFIDNNLKYK